MKVNRYEDDRREALVEVEGVTFNGDVFTFLPNDEIRRRLPVVSGLSVELEEQKDYHDEIEEKTANLPSKIMVQNLLYGIYRDNPFTDSSHLHEHRITYERP